MGIPLCSKMEFAADAGTVTGLKDLKMDGIDVLKVNASYDKYVVVRFKLKEEEEKVVPNATFGP